MTAWLAPTETERILSERHLARVQASVKRLDDEIDDLTYEAVSTGKVRHDGSTPRIRYLKWCREQVPRWVMEAEARARRREAS